LTTEPTEAEKKRTKGWKKTDKHREYFELALARFSPPLTPITRGHDVSRGTILIRKGNIQNFLEKYHKSNPLSVNFGII
jgi:hypothetical protein